MKHVDEHQAKFTTWCYVYLRTHREGLVMSSINLALGYDFRLASS